VKKPLRLERGDTIGIISPGSPVEEEKMYAGIACIERHGYKTRIGRHALGESGYLAGPDEQRLDDLHEMFAAPDVKAVFLSRGGYGTGRLLKLIDYSLIRGNPKILVGYSDATALQWALLRQASLITFSGPMVVPDFGIKSINEVSTNHCWLLLSGNGEAGRLSEYADTQLEIIYPGSASGPILCGCLSLITSIVGTQFCPEFDGVILVIEEIGEEPYRLDRAINTLELHGVFEKISGLVLGKFVDCEAERPRERHISIREIVLPLVRKYNIPTLMNFPYGHISGKITIPIGAQAVINTSNLSFSLTDNPVS